jgi:hypothetical protein
MDPATERCQARSGHPYSGAVHTPLVRPPFYAWHVEFYPVWHQALQCECNIAISELYGLPMQIRMNLDRSKTKTSSLVHDGYAGNLG